MSTKYEITKHEFSVDVRRLSDNHACGFPPKKVWKDMGSRYVADILYTTEEEKAGIIPDGKKVGDVFIPGDTLPEGKKVGDVKVAAKGWQEEDYDWDAELTRVFGEVDADVKTAITSHFTDDLKAKYVTAEKAK